MATDVGVLREARQARRGSVREVARALVAVSRGIGLAVRSRPLVFWGVAAGVLIFDLLAPIAILSVARKPIDSFSFNAWLPRLPEYLASNVTLARKLEFLSGMAIGWFSSQGGYEGADMGVVVDVPFLARILLSSLVFGTYYALWSHRRRQVRACGADLKAVRPAGIAGAVTTVFGLTTGPCSVAGCGAPVLPVLGLAFTGLESETISLFTAVSRVSYLAVIVLTIAAVAWLGWRAGTEPIAEPVGSA